MITHIRSIILHELKMDDLQMAFDNYSRTIGNDEDPHSITIKLSTNFIGIRVNKDNQRQVSVMLNIEMKFLTEDENKEEDKLSSINVKYEIRLDVDKEIPDSSDESVEKVVPQNEVLNIVEPYFRELISTLIDRTEISLGPIPYHFWENK
ncbi:hypothetical protein LBR04_22940 [Levilactobacillus brevis]|uniref:hypothetical protein n=2 Tax=Levilactobacillus brevis TaxID=1580 RepID=UPI0011447318|nr:hypothetical protein [Levilactobacillus brevis]GEB75555.1 hypothetical protein LBR04_22940 [Levilactobacillus brevis]